MNAMIDERAAAGAAGTLPSYRGDARRQEFRSRMEMRTAMKDDKSFLVLDGYASTVEQGYTMYDMFGEYTEVVDRGAFDQTLKTAPDVNFLINHTGLSMARTVAGTLELSADETGLRSIAYLNPQRSDVQDLEHAIRDGALDQMSFAFRITEGQWSPDYTEYRITQVDLNRGDVSAVNFGANPFTSISARAKQALTAIDHLEGEPLRIAAARAQARLAETQTVEPDPEPVKRTGPTVAVLRRRLELGL